MPFSDLESWLTQFGAAALRTQEILNQGWQQELNRFQAMTAEAPPESQDLLRPLVPSRQLLQKYEFQLSAVVSLKKLEEFKVRLLPLNLAYSITRRSRAENHSKFRLYVEQVPTR